MKPRILRFFPPCETLITPHVTSNVLSREGIAITTRATRNTVSKTPSQMDEAPWCYNLKYMWVWYWISTVQIKSYLAKSFCIFIGKGSVEGEGIARVCNL